MIWRVDKSSKWVRYSDGIVYYEPETTFIYRLFGIPVWITTICDPDWGRANAR